MGSVSPAAMAAIQSCVMVRTISARNSPASSALISEISRPYQNAAPTLSTNGTCASTYSGG